MPSDVDPVLSPLVRPGNPADELRGLEHDRRMARARELKRRRQARWTRADDNKLGVVGRWGHEIGNSGQMVYRRTQTRTQANRAKRQDAIHSRVSKADLNFRRVRNEASKEGFRLRLFRPCASSAGNFHGTVPAVTS